jgi:DNA-binding CsgD family transcriptional regulator
MILADSALAAFLRMLADLPDPDTVAAALAQGALAAFRPDAAVIGSIDLERQIISADGSFGVSPEVLEYYAAVPLDTDLPATICYRSNAIITTPSAQMAVDFPLVAPYVNAAPAPAEGESIVFPIRLRGAVVAVLGLDFAQPVTEPWHLRSAVSTLAGPLAMWCTLRREFGDATTTHRGRPDRPLTITDRQRRIIALLREGCTNPQIAAEIGYSVPTIKSELAHLRVLLGATSRTDLVIRATRAGY